MYEKKPFFFHLYLQRSGPEGTSIERNPRLPIEKTGRSLQQFPEYSTGKNNCCKSRAMQGKGYKTETSPEIVTC